MTNSKMKEIRWHGRGGQGAKTVSELLALALMYHGQFVQSFPEYGPERSGAPLQAYTRSSDKPIRLHCGVTNPDIVVVLDDSLLHEIPVTEGLSEKGFILVNTKAAKEYIQSLLKWDHALYCIDAEQIAVETGLGFSNVVMAGCLAAAMHTPPLETLLKAGQKQLSHKLLPKLVDLNLAAIEAGYHASEHLEEEETV